MSRNVDGNLQKYAAFVRAYRAVEKQMYVVSGSGEDMMLCTNCNNKSLVAETTQLRAADEESNIVHWCLICHRKYALNNEQTFANADTEADS